MRINRLLVLLTCALLWMPCEGITESPFEMIPKVAPQFVRPDLNGHPINLQSYRGRVVLLNFWATWCASCQLELPRFEAWQKQYGQDGLKVLTISMDDGVAPVRKTVRRLHLGLPVVMGDAKLGEAYGGVLGLPVTFLVGRDGRIVAKFKGETDLGVLESRVKDLLAQ